MLPGLLHLRCACAVLAILSYRLLFHTDRALSLGALCLALVCAASVGALLGDAAALLPYTPTFTTIHQSEQCADAADSNAYSNDLQNAEIMRDAVAALEWLRDAWTNAAAPSV